MQRYCETRMNLKRKIVSICPLLAILAPVAMAAPLVGHTEVTPSIAHFVGRQAPALLVTTLDGKSVSLAEYRGKALLVNFWATWCGACKLEMPWLAQLREQYKGRGFEIIVIMTDGATEERVRQIAAKYGVTYQIARCNHKTAQAYGGLPYLPESFYIDKHGKIVLAAADAGSKGEIETNIRKLLGLGAK